MLSRGSTRNMKKKAILFDYVKVCLAIINDYTFKGFILCVVSGRWNKWHKRCQDLKKFCFMPNRFELLMNSYVIFKRKQSVMEVGQWKQKNEFHLNRVISGNDSDLN